MKFSVLSTYFKKIEEVSSRLEMTNILAELFSLTDATTISEVVYLLQGRIAPLYAHIEFGIAEKMLLKATSQSLEIPLDEITAVFKEKGDLGTTVEEIKHKHNLSYTETSVHEVFEVLTEVAHLTGNGSQEKKLTLLANMMTKLDPLSSRYFVRIPTATLRLGFSDMTILDAFSWMLTGNKSVRSEIEAAFHVNPDIGFIGSQLKKHGIESMKDIQPRIFTPILMMRAERAKDPEDIIEKIGECIIESKFDGFRLQAHYKKGEVKLYSRNLDDMSYMFPDLIEAIQRDIDADEVIFEGEAIGYNPESGELLPFQETVQRKRKYDISDKAKEIPLRIYMFDLLFLNGNSYLSAPFTKRRELLSTIIKEDKKNKTLIIAEETLVQNADQISALFEVAVRKGLEGIMAKKLTGLYTAGARGFNWIKYKKSYNQKLQDTIDTVVMGYDYGKGKRTSFGLGAFLVGVYDQKEDKFVTVAKIGTGLTDEEWKNLKTRIDEDLIVDTQPTLYSVDKNIAPDVWMKPKIVVEIRADEITRSPVHTAGRVMKKSVSGSALIVDIAGFALRFPRLERFRDDKSPTDATTVTEVEKIYKMQSEKS